MPWTAKKALLSTGTAFLSTKRGSFKMQERLFCFLKKALLMRKMGCFACQKRLFCGSERGVLERNFVIIACQSAVYENTKIRRHFRKKTCEFWNDAVFCVKKCWVFGIIQDLCIRNDTILSTSASLRRCWSWSRKSLKVEESKSWDCSVCFTIFPEVSPNSKLLDSSTFWLLDLRSAPSYRPPAKICSSTSNDFSSGNDGMWSL